MLEIGLAGGLDHWRVDLDRLPETAAFVAEVIRDQYPDLKVPFHARWRHFVFGGRDLWAELADAAGEEPDARARTAFDLAIVSVLLDAGSGPGWRYRDAAAGIEAARSEGLALASLRMFQAGALAGPEGGLKATAAGLQGLTAEGLAEGFQVSADNPLAGLEGRPLEFRVTSN